MKKEKKVLTPEEKFKKELQTETELLRIQRQYHILDSSRTALASSGLLAKQKKVINILRKEYNEILTDLAVAGSDLNAKADSKIADRLQSLLEEHNQFVSDIKREKAYLKELDMQIVMAKKSIIELRKRSLSDAQTTQRIMEGQRTYAELENKLEGATKRFCTTLTENRKLREEIDHLLKERAHFNKLWDRLVANLSQGKKFMLDLIEQATISYDQREDWCQKLQTLRIRAYSEVMTHTQEATDMERRIENERKLQEFLTIKGQKRIMKNLMAKEQKKREKQRQQMEELLEMYTHMLEEIKDFMGESDLHKVADKFAQTELDNFAMFNYINEINKSLEILSDELMMLHMDIDAERKLQEIRENEHAATIAKLEIKLDVSKKEVDEAKIKLQATTTNLTELLEGIERVFKICKCSNAPLLELLGRNSSVNEHNVLLYLQILERKMNELIMTVYFKERAARRAGTAKRGYGTIREETVHHNIILIQDVAPKDPCPLCVEQALVSDVIDSLQKVMDKDEIKAKLAEAIEKRGFSEVVHNVSGCHLPKSRAIIQRRYQ